MDEQLLIRNKRLIPGGIAWDLKGDLTKPSESMLLTDYPWSHPQHELKFFVLNFSEVQYINSSGIALLIRLLRSAMNDGGLETFAYGLAAHYQKLFRMVGLTEYMSIYPDEYSIHQHIAASR